MEESVKRFMALAPLLLPRLIRENKIISAEEADNVAVMRFQLDTELPITVVMDMLEDDMELCLLFYGRRKNLKGGECCFYTAPTKRNMYRFEANSDTKNCVHELSIYIYDSIEVMESDLENNLKRGKEELDMVQSIEFDELITQFFVLS